MDVPYYRDDVDEESLVVYLAIGVARHTALAAAADDQFAFFHIGEVYTGLFAPKAVQSQGTLVTQDIVVMPLIGIVPVPGCLPLNHHKVFDVLPDGIVLLKPYDSGMYFFARLDNLLTQGICLHYISFSIFFKAVQVELTALICHLNFEDMLDVCWIELEVFWVDILYRRVDGFYFVVLASQVDRDILNDVTL